MTTPTLETLRRTSEDLPMNPELYNRLAKVDEEHFRLDGGWLFWAEPGSGQWMLTPENKPGDNSLIVCSWWCLEQMQEVHADRNLGKAVYDVLCEIAGLSPMALTPEKILTAYADMCEARKEG